LIIKTKLFLSFVAIATEGKKAEVLRINGLRGN